jgi:hypothetical protein
MTYTEILKEVLNTMKAMDLHFIPIYFNYDRDHLICYDAFNEEIAFVLISKKDGSIVKEIKIPFKEKKLFRAKIRG